MSVMWDLQEVTSGTDMLAKGSQVSLRLYMVSNDGCVHSLPSRFPVLTA